VDSLTGCCINGTGYEADAAVIDTRLELVRWQVMKALDFEDDPTALFERTCMLKVMWSELWQDVTSLALAHTCPNHEAHWRNQYLETRAATIYSGSNEIQRNIIGDRVLGLPR
jgi:alkylation response protein AidB-like acyl-CoA dehydrogenase